MRIGFDIDGVLANFVKGYQDLTVKVTGRDLFHSNDILDPPCWDWPQFRGYTKEEMSFSSGPVWGAIKSDPEFWYRLEEDPGAAVLRANWRKILDAGHDVVFATSRFGINPDMQTAAWLRNIGATYTDVTVTSDKGQFCLDRFVDCYIDDNLDNIKNVSKTSPATRTYLLNRAYNADTDFPCYLRVPTVEAFFVAEGLL
jgi:hypothetical protein